MLNYLEPAITEFFTEGVRVRILHEYQNHPLVSGNKWWKLKYNLEQAKKEGYDTLLTFGGAYSNHIYATAAAAREYGFKSTGIIRGEEVDNPTLRFALEQGMKLEFISREDYRRKDELKFPGVYVIPEGGTNEFAIQGCAEWGKMLLSIDFDQLYVAVGTCGTLKGLMKGIDGKREVIGVPVLKNSDFGDVKLLKEYHHGGYAKTTKELLEFCEIMKAKYDIIVEPTYTGKLFWAVFDQIDKGLIQKGTTVLIIHSGGLQVLSK
ncbi:MAG: pyridoxal-phosphate dependent enzyme [Bacteroidota bacterium]